MERPDELREPVDVSTDQDKRAGWKRVTNGAWTYTFIMLPELQIPSMPGDPTPDVIWSLYSYRRANDAERQLFIPT